MGLFDLGFVVSALGSETVTVTRQAADTYGSNGVVNARTTAAVFTPKVSVQPMSGIDQKLLPEGVRSSDNRTVFCPIVLIEGDLITTSEGVYEIVKIMPWATSGGYCKAALQKRAPGEPEV